MKGKDTGLGTARGYRDSEAFTNGEESPELYTSRKLPGGAA
jgi:hypothetical protein